MFLILCPRSHFARAPRKRLEPVLRVCAPSALCPPRAPLPVLGRALLGRAGDWDAQAAELISLHVWEKGKRTLSPTASFACEDVAAYADAEGVPLDRPQLCLPVQRTHRGHEAAEGLPWT